MKFLIIYATTEGKHERFMEDELKQNGHKVTLADASDQPPTQRL
jgi:menaquinone-dependent protoporphyrinogen IX oxidase